MERKGIVIYLDWLGDVCDTLDNASVGELFKRVHEYVKTGETPKDCKNAVVTFAFNHAKRFLDADKEKYNAMCERNRANAQRGGAPKRNNNARKKQPSGCEWERVGASGSENNPIQPNTNTNTNTNTDNKEKEQKENFSLSPSATAEDVEIISDPIADLSRWLEDCIFELEPTAKSCGVNAMQFVEEACAVLQDWQVSKIDKSEITQAHLINATRYKITHKPPADKETKRHQEKENWRNSILMGAVGDMRRINETNKQQIF